MVSREPWNTTSLSPLSPGRRVPGPTALEEAGVPPVRVPPGSRPDDARRPPAGTPEKRIQAASRPRQERKAGPSTPRPALSAHPDARTAPAPPPVRATDPPVGSKSTSTGGSGGAPPAPGPGLPEAGSPAGKPPSSADAPSERPEQQQTPGSQAEGQRIVTEERPAHVLTPPALLTAAGGEFFEWAQVILDRSVLTPQLRATALEGKVVLAVLVRTDGSVGQVKVDVSSGVEALDAAAVRVSRAWHFRPATRDGVAIDAWAIIPVRFTLP
jgi:protein TonB